MAWPAPQVGTLHPIEPLTALPNGLAIIRNAEPSKPFTVAGDHGAILGQQDGAFEAWIFPLKVLSQFHIAAVLEDGAVIGVNQHATSIEVTPAATTIAYSYGTFTIRQRMFAPRGDPAGIAAIFEIDSARPLRLKFSFKTEMVRMWPAPNPGAPATRWIGSRESGYYLLQNGNVCAAMAIPAASGGAVPEFNLLFEPARDQTRHFPLLIAAGGCKEDFGPRLKDLNDRLFALYSQTQRYYQHFFDARLTADTPDVEFDHALQWAEIAIDQAQVNFHGETGLIAGYGRSDRSARPGYAWFFGRDALWTCYAINSYGDFALTRKALEFLIRRQRADGKIMHEFSQTADLVDWTSLPYYYAAADSTPLFVIALEDYVNVSGDLLFLRSHWDAARRAYAFTRAHTDSNGIYQNTEGTGWVESWRKRPPHQEIYLAALDQQSAQAISHLAALMQDNNALVESANRTAAQIRANMDRQFYDSRRHIYAFSRNHDGTLDRTSTMFPSVAWWTGRLALPSANEMLSRWASHEFSTAWGVRDVSEREAIYDPGSYHRGSVWPLFTGWVSLAEYRAGRDLAGYSHLMQNADLTWAHDLGAVSELLSGASFQPIEQSTPHQTWSSAMVLAPALRGLFGLDWDALHRTLRLAPHLPANWDSARLRNLRLGDLQIELNYRREGDHLAIEARLKTPEVLCLVPQNEVLAACAEPPQIMHQLSVPLAPVEIALPHALPAPRSRNGALRVIRQEISSNQADFEFEAPGGSSYELPVRLHRQPVKVQGAELARDRMQIRFPSTAGYGRLDVTFRW